MEISKEFTVRELTAICLVKIKGECTNDAAAKLDAELRAIYRQEWPICHVVIDGSEIERFVDCFFLWMLITWGEIFQIAGGGMPIVNPSMIFLGQLADKRFDEYLGVYFTKEDAIASFFPHIADGFFPL